jgi:putative membrane protein
MNTRILRNALPGLTVAAVALSATALAADPYNGWSNGYGNMMWGGGFGLIGGLMMLLFWGGIIALIYFVVRSFSDRPSGGGGRTSTDAMNILRDRFARGEIDAEEFETRKRALES